MSIRDIQTRLKQLGYDPGPIDGINGPRTKAAVRKFQSDQGLTVDGIVGPNTTAAFEGAEAGTTTEQGDDEKDADSSVRQAIEENYPTMAWALDHDELGPLLEQAGEEEWSALKLQGKLQGTEWWQEHTRGQRELQIGNGVRQHPVTPAPGIALPEPLG